MLLHRRVVDNSCGFWPPTPASMDLLAQGKSNRTRCATTYNVAIPVATEYDMGPRQPCSQGCAAGLLNSFCNGVATSGTNFTATPSIECSDLYLPFTLRARAGLVEAAASSRYISK
jgi:hypothetical protein